MPLASPVDVPDHGSLVDRATGYLLGLAVGDAMGDLRRTDSYRQRYGIVTQIYCAFSPSGSSSAASPRSA